MVQLSAAFASLQDLAQLPWIELFVFLGKYALTVFILRCLIVYPYRIFFHPLSQYPGPLLAKCTDWYSAIFAMQMRLHLSAYQDLQKYGPVVRLGPNKLAFKSTTALRDIYQNPRIRKAESYSTTQLTKGVTNLFNVLDKRVHRMKRRIIGQGLSQVSMQKFEPIMSSYIDTFVKLIAQSKEPVNVTLACKYLGTDIIGMLGFGASLNTQTIADNRWMVAGMKNVNYRMNYRMQFPGLYYLYHHFFPQVLWSRLRYIRAVLKMIKERLAIGIHSKTDLLSFVYDEVDPETGKRIEIKELWTEALILFPAGADTTSTTMTTLMFYLSRYPECYKRLTEEIRSTFKSGDAIKSGPILSSCSYLRACIDEALRISPPVGGVLWRELEPNDKDPYMIDGNLIPPGTSVGVSIYALHHDPDYFKDPFVFRPERWLMNDNASEDIKEEKKRMHDAFTPFSIGSRGCAGKAMAYMEASLTMAKLMWYCDFERSQGPLDKVGSGGAGKGQGREKEMEYQLEDIMVSSHDGPYLVFKPRNEAWKKL